MLKSSSQLDAILDEMSEGILLFNPEGEIAYQNRAAEQMPQDFDFGFSLKKAIVERKAPEKLTVPFKEKELLIRTHFLGTNLLIIVQDITETKQLEKLALRHDRMKELGDMVATVAHEIRNPLGGIRGFATLLHRDLKKEPHLQEMAQHIIEGSDHLSRFVTNVLNYARPAQAHLTPTDLNSLVEELKIHVEADHSLDCRIKIQFIPSPTPVVANVDTPLLQSALLNLVVNAIQAMPNGGDLTLKVTQVANLATIQVSDSGEGISTEHIPKLFSPFFTTRSSGNGFGLAEVKKIVQVHGGTIHVESEIGKGTTFKLNLPKENGG